MSESTGLSQRAYARHRGCDVSLVNRWFHGGRLVLTADRKIDAAASDAALAETISPSHGGRGGGGILTRAAAEEKPEAPEISDAMSLTAARTASAVYKAKQDEADYRKSIGELVELAKVRAGNTAAYGAVVRALQQARIRLAPLVIAAADEHRAYELLGIEFDAALTELADTIAALPEQLTATSQ